MRGMFKRSGLSVLLGSLLLIGGASTSLAQPPLQEGAPGRTVTHDQTGFLTFVGVDTAAPDTTLPGAQAFQPSGPTAATAMADIAVYARQFGLDNPAQELQLRQSVAIPGGSAAFRYQQVHQGIPVIAGEMLANYNARGRLSALAGETSPQLALSTTPNVTADAALTLALDYVARESSVPVSELTGSAPALWIYDPRLLQPSILPARLVWRTEITPARGHAPIRYLVLVDAQLLTVALAFNQVDMFWGDHAAAYAGQDRPSVSTADLPAFAPHFTNPLGVTYNSNFTSSQQVNPVCSTPPAALMGAGSCDGTASATFANMAHYFAYNTFHYYDSQHNRNSIDNAGMALISNVNYREDPTEPFANAFWDGVQMTYGDADTFTVDDVVAHELSHGVTERSSNLFYFYESGAINESMSDVFGEFADQWNGINSFGGADSPSDQWLMGEDMTAPPIRNMANPTIYHDPDSTQSPFYWTSPDDNGGVHINSGVSNKAAYLMAAGGTFGGYTITAIGNAKTAAIYYEANTTLLTSGADYQILAAALVQACNNIRIGANPLAITAADCEEVNEATRAVGMHLDPVAGVEFAPQASLCPSANTAPVYLFQDDFESGLGNFEDGTLLDPNNMPPQYAFQTTLESFGAPYAVSGTGSMFGVNHPRLYDPYYTDTKVYYPYESYAAMVNPVSLPAGSTYYLHFSHAVALEAVGISTIRDGAFLEYSVDGGVSWQNIAPLFDGGKNYDGPIYPGFGNPRANQPAFGGQSHGYVSSRYNLAALAGSSVKFRWVIAADASFNYWGWFIDDVQIYTCAPASLGVTSPDGSSISANGTYSLGLTFLNEPITRTITVSNTGQADLMLLSAAPSVPDGFTTTLYGQTVLTPGASTSFDLTCSAAAAGSPVKGAVSIYTEFVTFNFTVDCTVIAPGTTAYATRNYYTTPVVTLTWSPVTWATRYEVQVSQSRYFTGAPIIPVDPPGALIKDVSLTAEGLYYWRVRAIRANGTPGTWSAADTFFLNLP